MNKKLFQMFFAGFLILAFSSLAFANHGGHECSRPDGGCGQSEGCDGKGKYECPIVAKIMKKAEFFLDNQQELGLSDEQVANIKSIKVETKKAYAKQAAEMQIFQIDLESKLSDTKVDVEGLNTMIDSGMQGMAGAAKAGVANYAKLKGILTEEQMKKAKEIWLSDSKH